MDGESRVVIPYVPTLAELFPAVATRLRRDFVSTLCLIRAHAILHQVTRPRDALGRIVATVEDYQQVRELVGALIAEAVDASVSEAMRNTVETVRALLDQRAVECTSMRAITDALSVGRSAAYDRVSRALSSGYLVNLANKDERAWKIGLGAALPDEELFLPDVEALVRASSASAIGQTSGSTMRESTTLSGSPGRPGYPLVGDEGFDDFLLAAVNGGHITPKEGSERLDMHKLVQQARAAGYGVTLAELLGEVKSAGGDELQ